MLNAWDDPTRTSHVRMLYSKLQSLPHVFRGSDSDTMRRCLLMWRSAAFNHEPYTTWVNEGPQGSGAQNYNSERLSRMDSPIRK